MRDGTGKLPTPNSHMDNRYGTETMVYNRKRNEKNKKKKKGTKTKRIREAEEI